MQQLKNFYFQNQYLIKSGILYAFLLIVFLTVIITAIQNLFLKENKTYLERLAQRIQFDLTFHDNRWDTTLYNSDPETPYPNSSGNTPIYIITNEGYVIERSKPIDGFLDTADMKHLLQFEQPTTLNALTNESWRVVSKEIKYEQNTVGAVIVAYHNPEENILSDIDAKLQTNLNRISDQLKINGDINASNIDIRQLDYNITFGIVSKSNKLILLHGRIPTFIDPSYVENELKNLNYRNLTDDNSGETFLLFAQPLLTSDNKTGGIIIVARSTEFMNSLIWSIILNSFIFIFISTVLFIYFIKKINKAHLKELVIKELHLRSQRKEPQSICFDSKNSILDIDGERFHIAYSTNQYYMCKSLFSKPTKRWENDELSEIFGESDSASSIKKIYDTALALNKKVNFKLIKYEDKTYFINPAYSRLIKYLKK